MIRIQRTHEALSADDLRQRSSYARARNGERKGAVALRGCLVPGAVT